MRVLLACHRFPPDDFGGVEFYTQRLAAELVKRGDTVTVAARRWAKTPQEPETVREQLADGTWVYRFAGGGARLDRFQLIHFLRHHERLEELFERVLDETAPDVVHFNHLVGLSPRSIAITQRRKIPVVLSLHDFYFACPLVHLRKATGELCAGPDAGRECIRTCFGDPIEHDQSMSRRWGLRSMNFRRWLTQADRVICYSEYMATYFRDYGLDSERLRIIPNGVTLSARPRAGFSPPANGTLNLAYCGTVAHHKGCHVILEALRSAGLCSVDLRLIGHFDDASYVRALRQQAALIPGLKFRLYGPYRVAELCHLLKDVHCVVVPSLVPEAGPIVPREALALGVPIVVARLGALPELVAEGENGFTFDPEHPDELTAILKRFAEDGQLLNHLYRGARMTRPVTLSDHVQAVQSVYQEVMAGATEARGGRRTDAVEAEFLHKLLVGLEPVGVSQQP